MTRRISLLVLVTVAFLLLGHSAGADDRPVGNSGSPPQVSARAEEETDGSLAAASQMATNPTAYLIPWQSLNAGGVPAASANYKLNGSAGQSVIGYATSSGYRHGIGYWYGTGAACDCGVWGDATGDGLINPIDVVRMVNFVYKSQDQRVQPPNCPNQAGDVNCDGAVNPVDIVRYVNYVYKGQTSAFCADPCGP